MIKIHILENSPQKTTTKISPMKIDISKKDENLSDEQLQKLATSQYIETIRQLKPGLSMVIMHCTAPSEIFKHIGTSGRVRKADMLAMTDPAFRKFLNDENIILTTWRELKQLRQKAGVK